MPISGGGGIITTTSASAPFVGAGDVVPGAVAWWGLRAYTAATKGNNCAKIFRTSDSTLKIINTSASTGYLDLTDPFFDGSTYHIDTLYDQTGNGNHMIENTDANRPLLTLNVLSGFPTAVFDNAASKDLQIVGTITVTHPYSFSSVAIRTGNTAANNCIIGNLSNLSQMGFSLTSGNVYLYDGSLVPTATSSEGNWHSVQAMFNGVNSILSVDGTNTAVSAGATGNPGALTYQLGAGGSFLKGDIMEAGIWNSDISGSFASLSSNQHGSSGWNF